MTTTIVHPIAQPEADAVRCVLWATAHIPVTVHVDNEHHLTVQPAGRALTTGEEVTALRAFTAVTDARVDWNPAVAR